MAVEEKRGCGYRKVGGMYLVGGILSAPCDRLPYPLEVCPTCNQGIKVSRGFTEILPYELFGIHKDCQDKVKPCVMCYPNKYRPGYIMIVGERHYPKPSDFIKEGHNLGVCKRIPFVPKDLILKKTVIYLAHHKAIIKRGNGKVGKKGQTKMLEYATGIFCAFVPTKIEQLVWESQLKGKKGKGLKQSLKKRGITPVPIPDKDKDHA
jgi:hypothetical protein